MGNEIKVTYAGDATALEKANKQAEESTLGVGDAATQANRDTAEFASRMGSLGSAVTGANDAIMGISDGLNALVDFQSAAAERASRLARAQADVEQAMIDAEQAVVDLEQAQRDLNQSQLDGAQAGVDVKQAAQDQAQAALDAEAATIAYRDAVKEHGKGSVEAKQAMLDMNQAVVDAQQANVDAAQAQEDLAQAQLDGKQAVVDAAQATRDAKDAQLDLNDAQREANPTDLQKFMEQVNAVTPLLSAMVGVIGLVTAAQWAWNIAQLASPTTWIVLAIVALVGVIVLIATKTDWFQKLWKAAWGGIKAAAASVWDFLQKIPGWIGAYYKGVANLITAPFRAAFNFIADAWNATIGSLSFTFPGWIPGIGGNNISVPSIPKFHTGGVASGAMGSEFLAVLQAGERITPAGGGGGGVVAAEFHGGGNLGRLLGAFVEQAVDNGQIRLYVRNGRVVSRA